jgi:LuxR family maltose regulon positive regulatory protein
MLALKALAYQAQNKIDTAVAVLEQALSRAEPGGYIRTFVDEGSPMATLLTQAALDNVVPDYTSNLLASFPGEINSPIASTDLLTKREQEVLRLMATGLSTNQIAAELVISIHTARTHIKRILSKLRANNRVEAVERARSLNLL